ncbi:putative glycosyltransferase [Cavenderia fasciculata]|uniref:Glycosyltransferase n=1 Tax=Cavenderia fasciculata TaxID=261658 RepID=F4PL24_CACFS|nr:putative glycosyltransferase [Cavenderia fasciculata]EGG23246.1 putative glycosyltransferase [Cavenderia fasciculata]|eukprot:XP_004361097.1 putative glycosyltransferase [Cavenderia fasciculata]
MKIISNSVNVKGIVITILILIHVFYGCVFFYNYGYYKSEQYMATVQQKDLDTNLQQLQQPSHQQQQQQSLERNKQQEEKERQEREKDKKEDERLMKLEDEIEQKRKRDRENALKELNSIRQHNITKYAYITYVDNIKYAQGVAVLKQSLEDVGSIYDFVVMVSMDFDAGAIHRLQKIGAIVETVHPIDVPKGVSVQTERWMSAFTKFRSWEQIHYEKIMWLDSDLLVLKNIDDLFDATTDNPLEIYSTIDANANSCVYDDNRIQLINSGLMVLTPSLKTYKLLLESLETIAQHTKVTNDQDVLSNALKWHPLHYPEFGAQIPHCECGDRRLWDFEKIKVLHYTAGLKSLPKPWEYFSDTNQGLSEPQTTNPNKIEYQGVPQCVKGLYDLWHDKYDEETFKLAHGEFSLQDWSKTKLKEKKSNQIK